MKKEKWFYTAAGCMAVSAAAMLLLPVLTYVSSSGRATSFYLYQFVFQSGVFADTVLSQYTGPVIYFFTGFDIVMLALMFIVCFVLACIGISTLRTQYLQRSQMILTTAGIVGTSIPAFLILLGVVLSGRYFSGTIRCGAAPILGPAAALICLVTVVRRSSYLKAKALEKEGRQLIRRASDL